jgi:hypothetical protein
VSASAEWCGQCYQPLRPPAGGAPASDPELARLAGSEDVGEPEPAAGREEPVRAARSEPTWTCPVCDTPNAIDLDRCGVCGTPFASLFAEPEPSHRIEPSHAFAWSLLLPGLGHWKAGRKLEGVARMVLCAWTLGTVVVFLTSRSGTGGLGPAAPLVWLFAVATLVLWATSAVDARRSAAGDPPLVSSRQLLWAVIGLVIVSVMLATVLTLPLGRSG